MKNIECIDYMGLPKRCLLCSSNCKSVKLNIFCVSTISYVVIKSLKSSLKNYKFVRLSENTPQYKEVEPLKTRVSFPEKQMSLKNLEIYGIQNVRKVS